MARRSLQELRDEVNPLMLQRIESVNAETFPGRLDEEVLLQQEERRKRIPEVSPVPLAALKRSAA
jgi:hypothetical protein